MALLAFLGAAGAGAGEPPGLDLDAFWRAFFSRPAGIPAPLDNPVTPEKAALGRALFADPRLSGTGTRACIDCHRSSRGFTDGQRTARAIDGSALARNVPALWNLAWSRHYFWDGRAESLEAQASVPIEHPQEMGGDWATIAERLAADEPMTRAFAAAFPQDPRITRENILKALATYERTLVSPITRFDRWVAGEEAALSPKELAGFRIFVGKGGCVGCHAGWRFTDGRFHDTGLPGDDPGRGAVAGGVPGLKAFKTPGLRELAWTAPYMHDGSLPTLEAVIDHYAGKFVSRPGLATNMVRELRLDTEERASLIAFLETLSSDAPPTEGDTKSLAGR